MLNETGRKDIRYPRWVSGVGGSNDDLITNLETCLRVQRFERARTIILRLATQQKEDDDANFVAMAHYRYLSTRLESLPESQEHKYRTTDEMRDWFETQIMAKGVPLGPDLLIVMTRAALQGLTGAKQERVIRRYFELAAALGPDVVEQLENSDDYTDQEYLWLSGIISGLQVEDPLPATQPAHHDAVPSETPSKHDLTQELPGIFGPPQVRPTEQKGPGLRSLKESLHLAQSALEPTIYSDPSRNLSDPRERQKLIEESASEAAVARWKEDAEHLKSIGIYNELDPRTPIGAIMWQWYTALLPGLREELDLCRRALDSVKDNSKFIDDRLHYAAHLESIPLELVAANTILHVMSLIAGGKSRDTDQFTSEMKLAGLSASLGRTMQQEADMLANRQADRRAKTGRRRRGTSPHQQPKKPSAPAPDLSSLLWPSAVRVKLGAVLVVRLLEVAKIPVTRTHPRTGEKITQLQPAFLHKTVYDHGRKQGYLSACPDLLAKMSHNPVGHLIAKRLPMVIEPEPWTDFAKGGYLYYPNSFIRFGNADKVPRDYAHAAIDRGDLDQVFAALNSLSKVPWIINPDILKFQIELWNRGDGIANFAPANPVREPVEKPLDAGDMHARRKYDAAVRQQNNMLSSYHSQRCFQNFQLEIARAFRNERLYFPHNIDFRGRAYPLPPYLNHMGADNARALMKFAEGKELGVQGLRWLKIHLANVFGYDKASLQEREAFTMDHLTDIYDSATNPLDGNRWWLKSEDAWQTLAACFELKAALDSPDPTKFVSHLPVHQDGTCNGLQHYAALGGDAIGARQVNLEPGDRPSDVYTAVAESVQAEVERDYNAGHPLAKALHGHITRKVVKQPVMTNVYGVTYYGARDQVRKQLMDIFPDVTREDGSDLMTMASYITKKIFKSLGAMFSGAQAIQQWLGQCADRISTCVTAEQITELQNEARGHGTPLGRTVPGPKRISTGTIRRVDQGKQLFRSSVIWTTPLRLPVVQPYRATKRTIVKTKISNLSLQDPSSSDPVSRRKQLQAFPPNFIHSLDATHMMLSANKCNEKNIAFASIHDSFWTHACDINDLSLILRDAFINMHSEDIVGRLHQEFLARYKGSMYLASVDLGSPVGKKLSEFYRKHRDKDTGESSIGQSWRTSQLLREVERLRLLESTDPEERKKGEQMETAGAIFAAEKDAEGALTIPHEITDSKLGDVPDGNASGSDTDVNASEAGLVDPVFKDQDGVETDAPEVNEMNVDVDNDADASGSAPVDEASSIPYISEEQLAEDLGKTKYRKQKYAPQARKCYVWLPLTFPKLPQKGTFDVSRLKESVYFFH